MKKQSKSTPVRVTAAAAALAAALLFGGCSGSIAENLVSGGASSAATADPSDAAATAEPQLTAETPEVDTDYTASDVDVGYEESTAVYVTLTGSGAEVSGDGVTVSGQTVTVTAEGDYVFTGTLTNGRIIVDAGDEKPHIILNGVDIYCESGAAIYVRQADKVFITLAAGTENTLECGGTAAADGDTAVDGCIFSCDDLTINGDGALTVTAGYKHGIVSKDDLVITGGTYTITAPSAGLEGKDCVKILAGVFTINAGSDGIRSTNEEDAERGYVLISGGTVSITAGSDGIQAVTLLQIDGGTLDIATGGGSGNASTSSGWGMWGGQSSTGTGDSAKGLKCTDAVVITGGTVALDTSDDSIHANGSVSISGGAVTAASGDDGVHADAAFIITGGTLDITKSYEGVEAAEIEFAGGTTHITASDDGVNSAGGADGSALGGRPGMGAFSSDASVLLISGGTLVIDAGGDGLDSNGTLTVTGGVTLVSGPTDSGNGALDYGSSASISGGVVIAAGSAGMAVSFTEAAQGAALVSCGNLSGGTRITLTGGDGNVIVSWAPSKQFSTVVISAPSMSAGSGYTLYTGGSIAVDSDGYAASGTLSGGSALTSFTLSSSGTYGSSSGGMGGGHGGGQSRP